MHLRSHGVCRMDYFAMLGEEDELLGGGGDSGARRAERGSVGEGRLGFGRGLGVLFFCDTPFRKKKS